MWSAKQLRLASVVLFSLSTLLLVIATAIPGWFVGGYTVHASFLDTLLTFDAHARIGAFQSCFTVTQHLSLPDGSSIDDTRDTCGPVTGSCQVTFNGVTAQGTFPPEEPSGCALLNVARVTLVASALLVGLAAVCGALLLTRLARSGLCHATPLLGIVQLVLMAVTLALFFDNIGLVEDSDPAGFNAKDSPYYSSQMGPSVYLACASALLTLLGTALWMGARKWGRAARSRFVLAQPPMDVSYSAPLPIFQHPQPHAYRINDIQLSEPLISSVDRR